MAGLVYEEASNMLRLTGGSEGEEEGLEEGLEVGWRWSWRRGCCPQLGGLWTGSPATLLMTGEADEALDRGRANMIPRSQSP